MGIGDEAVDLAAQPGQNGLVDAGFGHLGVGDNIAPGPEGLHTPLHRAGGEDQILRVVKICCGVDDPLDHRRDLRRRLAVPQQLRDSGVSSPLATPQPPCWPWRS